MTNLIEKTYYQLFENLTEGLIFYFPLNLDFKEVQVSTDSNEIDFFLDNMYIMDKTQGPIFFEEDAISKWDSNAINLNANKFELMAIRKKLDSLEFDWLLNEYVEKVVLYFDFSTFLHNEIKKSSSKTTAEKCSECIELQKCVLEMHLKDIIKIRSSAKNYSKPETSNGDILQLARNLFAESTINREDENIVKDDKNDNANSLNNEDTSEEEKVEIDMEAIERYLLETEFNVDFSKIHE